MRGSRNAWLLVLALLSAGAVLFLANTGGWRALIIARLSRVENWPVVVPLPSGFRPNVPPGFAVSVFATGFQTPRWLAVAADGAVFVADSAAGQIVVLREAAESGSRVTREVFAKGLTLPFGIVFLNDFVYVANTNAVLRFRYDPATSKRIGGPEHVLDLPGQGYHQHWTRSLAVSKDGTLVFVSVGSETNVSVEADPRRAAILSINPEGTNMRVHASGLRNAVGIAICPETGGLWASVNERDNLGDDVPSDYFTHVTKGAFYGWPYVYDGTHIDNRVPLNRELANKTVSPDLPLGAHVAPLQVAFYEGKQFPSGYAGGAFIAEHGSWNRRERAGYAVVFVPFRGGMPAGKPMPFMTGFVVDPMGKEVYGRPAGVAVAKDGSLLVADDGSRTIWRVSYQR
jgi:glucose/arabinose dehydrogenase